MCDPTAQLLSAGDWNMNIIMHLQNITYYYKSEHIALLAHPRLGATSHATINAIFTIKKLILKLIKIFKIDVKK